MKNLKLIGIAMAAALACFAAVGAGPAGATVLCKTSAKPCTEDYGAGTKFAAQLPFEMDMRWTKEPGGDTCFFSSLSGETSNTGGAGSRVIVPLSKLSWTSCGGTWETLKAGTLEIEIAKEGNANPVRLKGTEFRSGGCTYSTGTGIQAGILTNSGFGAVAPRLWINATVAWVSGGLCSPWARWEAIYEVTAPTPLYVAS